MGNSAVYLIHTSDDLGAAFGMAQRLLTLTATGCGCPREISAEATTGTHDDLTRYLSVGPALVSLSIPADQLSAVDRILTPVLPPDDRPRVRRDGDAFLITDLTPTVITALQLLPPVTAGVSTPGHPLPHDLADAVLTVVDNDQASIAWHVCWQAEHDRSGFELAVNGAELWHPHPPPGHSLYLHVHPREPERAQQLAAAVGGRVIGEPAVGW